MLSWSAAFTIEKPKAPVDKFTTKYQPIDIFCQVHMSLVREWSPKGQITKKMFMSALVYSL